MKVKSILKSSMLFVAASMFVLTGCDKESNEPDQPSASEPFTVYVLQNDNLVSVSDNDTITITETEVVLDEIQMLFDGEITNNSNSEASYTVTVERYYTEDLSDEFCAQTCQPGNGQTTQSFMAFTVNPSESQEFYAHFKPENSGEYMIRYDFHLTSDSSTKVSVYVNYKYEKK